jgi:hypothetical protein
VRRRGRGGEEGVGGGSEYRFYIIDLGFVEASVFKAIRSVVDG